jgi:DMSO/TMAO reductase YedYZ heme-binding membrane subunit
MLALQLTHLHTIAAVLRDRFREDHDRGSVTLEQIAIAAGLLALALVVVAAIGAVVTKYVGKLG